jgi:hypothetical protein
MAGSRAGPPVSEYVSPVATGKRNGFQKERQSKIDKKEEEGGERGIEIATETKKLAIGKILKTSRRLFENHSKIKTESMKVMSLNGMKKDEIIGEKNLQQE